MATARLMGIRQLTAAMTTDTSTVTGSSSGWNVIEELNTFTLTTWANTKPSIAPSTPPNIPRNTRSPV